MADSVSTLIHVPPLKKLSQHPEPSQQPDLFEIHHDHIYATTRSPRKLKKQMDKIIDSQRKTCRRLHVSRKKIKRIRRKVKSLQSVVDELRNKNLVSDDCATILENTFSGVSQELMSRIVTQQKKKNPGAYTPELRAFALTLKFYSTKAYNFVRKSFQNTT